MKPRNVKIPKKEPEILTTRNVQGKEEQFVIGYFVPIYGTVKHFKLAERMTLDRWYGKR